MKNAPVQENFVCAIEANARRFGAKTALLWDEGKLSWSELYDFTSGFSRYLSTQGVVAGDRDRGLTAERSRIRHRVPGNS